MKKIFILVPLCFHFLASFGQKNFISTDVFGAVARRPAITYERMLTHRISVVTEYRHYLLSRRNEGEGIFFSSSRDQTSITGGKVTVLARLYLNERKGKSWFLESGFFGGRLKLDYYGVYSSGTNFWGTGGSAPPIITTYNKRQNIAGMVIGGGFHPWGLEYLEMNFGMGRNIITIDGRFEPTSYQFYPYARLKLGIDW